MDRPVPAFYACYLLRSTVRHQNIYVGSTPHPVRRLKQHNGIAKGGAARTSKDTLRPWEMTCLVTGFPSKIAALQFEWAWQNTHLTRHIAPDERITQANTKTTARGRKRVGRPRMSMTDKLANLHILLRAKSFERWPLQVKFFAEDVYKMWHRWVVKLPEVLRHGILVELEPVKPQQDLADEDNQQPMGIHAIDPTYLHAKPMLEKSRRLLAATGTNCAVCQSALNTSKEMALACPEPDCNSLSHVACLSNHFLGAENATNAIVPTDGLCPVCESRICWTDMIKDLSLRIRGEKEVAVLFKERKRRKKGDLQAGKDTVALLEVEEDEDDLDDVLAGASDVEVDYDDALLRGEYEDIDSLQSLSSDDDWKIIDDIEGVDDQVVETATASKITKTSKTTKAPNTTKTPKSKRVVIEDSDWDEAEIID